MDHIKNNPKVQVLLAKTDEFTEKIGYTEHGVRHSELVARNAERILGELDYPIREQKLAAIAGYLHDIGNFINRINHAQIGAAIAYDILEEMRFKIEDVADICGAIGNHHENEGQPINTLAAALIIADKCDVHKSRVRKSANILLDIHDRVNFAVDHSEILIDKHKRKIKLDLHVDTKLSPVMEYFEIFVDRMLMSKKAAEVLNSEFELYINKNRIL